MMEHRQAIQSQNRGKVGKLQQYSHVYYITFLVADTLQLQYLRDLRTHLDITLPSQPVNQHPCTRQKESAVSEMMWTLPRNTVS